MTFKCKQSTFCVYCLNYLDYNRNIDTFVETNYWS